MFIQNTVFIKLIIHWHIFIDSTVIYVCNVCFFQVFNFSPLGNLNNKLDGLAQPVTLFILLSSFDFKIDIAPPLL